MEPTVAELVGINSLADLSAWSNLRDHTRLAVLRALGEPVTFCEVTILPWSDYKYVLDNTEHFVKIKEDNIETKQDPNCTFSLSNIAVEEMETFPINTTEAKANVILKPELQPKKESFKIDQVHSNLNDSLKTELPSTQGIKKDAKTLLRSIFLTNNNNTEISQKIGVETSKCT